MKCYLSFFLLHIARPKVITLSGAKYNYKHLWIQVKQQDATEQVTQLSNKENDSLYTVQDFKYTQKWLSSLTFWRLLNYFSSVLRNIFTKAPSVVLFPTMRWLKICKSRYVPCGQIWRQNYYRYDCNSWMLFVNQWRQTNELFIDIVLVVVSNDKLTTHIGW